MLFNLSLLIVPFIITAFLVTALCKIFLLFYYSYIEFLICLKQLLMKISNIVNNVVESSNLLLLTLIRNEFILIIKINLLEKYLFLELTKANAIIFKKQFLLANSMIPVLI